MNRILIVLLTLFISCLVTISVPAVNILENDQMQDEERPYYISTSGTTTPMNILPGCGWVCFFQMITPFPDQMYFSLGGIINYENGSTIITTNGEESFFEGSHKVIFFNFYGPVSTFDMYDVSLEGNTVFAKVLGG